MDIPRLAREAFTQLSTATALRKVGRLVDVIAATERARGRLTDAVNAVAALLAEMYTELSAPVDPPAEPEHIGG